MTAPARSRGAPDLADELAFSLEIAARAGRLLMERYERVEQVDYKSARDVVTEVDHMSEAMIIEAIRRAWPGDGIVAEESGEHAGTTSLVRGRTWVIDPLDGTINYANGIPVFCVSVALVVDSRPARAAISSEKASSSARSGAPRDRAGAVTAPRR